MKKYFIISLIAVLVISGWISLSLADTQTPRGKSAAAGLLPDELKSMRVDDYFVESNSGPAGSIQSVTGHVVVVHKDTNRAYFAATGDAVYQQDVFYTLKDSRCRIKFSTEDIITMGENSKVIADEIVDDQAAQKKSSVISMLKGKAMFYVVRLFKYKTISASVKTPTAVMGVRGTKFGVEVRKAGEKVADLSDDSFIYLAQNEPGNFETVVYGFDGEVEVNSTGDGSTNSVGAGETLVVDNLGSGDVEPTDPNAANQFVGDTEGGVGTEGTAGTDADAGTGEGGGAGETGDTANTADTTSENIAQTLTTQTIETQVVSGTRVGYFSALLTRSSDGYYLADVYTNSSRSDFDGSSVSGKSIVDPVGFISAINTGSNQSTPYLTQIKTVAGGLFDSGDLGTTSQMDNPDNTFGWPSDDRLGQNSYMEWGFWAMSRWVSNDSYPGEFAVTDRAYYIDGLVTSDSAVAGMSGTYAYAGPAWGTYFNGYGGTDMVGTFTSEINMTAKTVTDFDMSVSGGSDSAGSYSASISNASGSFVGSSGEFKITGGDWNLINPYETQLSAVSKSCTGSLYGPNAEHMGGAWAMDAGDNNNAAVGIFVGDKGGSPTTPALPPVITTPSDNLSVQ